MWAVWEGDKERDEGMGYALGGGIVVALCLLGRFVCHDGRERRERDKH